MNSPHIPLHLEPELRHNRIRQRQWWTASGVSAILCGSGCLLDSIQIAGTSFSLFFIAGMVAVAHRVGNDHILNELDRHKH